MRLLGAAFELADALIDERQKIRDAVGHGRVGGDRRTVRLPTHEARLAAKRLFRFRDQVAQRIDFLMDAGAAPENHFR